MLWLIVQLVSPCYSAEMPAWNQAIRLDLKRDDLAWVFERCERFHRRAASQKNIELFVEDVSSRPAVIIDRVRIVEVMDNLVSNAVKYTLPGGKIQVASETVQSEVVINVRDTGLGLTEKDLDSVFTGFKKLSARPTGGEESTGLGLAIVKKIVEMHQGRIWVSSEKGIGSMFSFSLPIALD